jgi:hypothetical protein
MRSEDIDALRAANKKLIEANREIRPLVKGDYVEVPLKEGAWRIGWLRVPQYKQGDEWYDVNHYENPDDTVCIYDLAADLIYDQLRSLCANFEVLKCLKKDLFCPVPCRVKGEDPDKLFICFTWGWDCAEEMRRPLIIPPNFIVGDDCELDTAEVGYIRFARNPLLLTQSVLFPPEKALKGQKYYFWLWNDLLLPWVGLVGGAYVEHTILQMSKGIEPIFSDGIATLQQQEDGNWKWRLIPNEKKK